jgi:hypothetical protein
MPESRLSNTLWCQGPMRLADTWCCLDCEVLFTGLECCPSCASSAIWPLAAWLSPPLPHLTPASSPVGAPPPSGPAAVPTGPASQRLGTPARVASWS